MHLSLTSLTRKIQSGLRAVQVKRQKIFTTEECSFSLYFIYYLRNLLLSCGGVEENVVRRSNTQDKHCLVGDGSYIREISSHSTWEILKFKKLSELMHYFGIGIYRQVPPLTKHQRSRSSVNAVPLIVMNSITFELSFTRRSAIA